MNGRIQIKFNIHLTKLLVGKRKNITAVGDACQSIYSWRGADYRNINYLMRDYPDIKVINLEQNYRSTQNILDAANLVISKNTSHPILKLWTEKKAGAKIKLYSARNGFDEADFVVSEIKSLIRQSDINYITGYCSSLSNQCPIPCFGRSYASCRNSIHSGWWSKIL